MTYWLLSAILRHSVMGPVGQIVNLRPIGNRPGSAWRRLPTTAQLAKLSGMGRRPTEVHENPFERRRTVDTMGSGAGARVFPVCGGWVFDAASQQPPKRGTAGAAAGDGVLRTGQAAQPGDASGPGMWSCYS
jgi:hypothetical protein